MACSNEEPPPPPSSGLAAVDTGDAIPATPSEPAEGWNYGGANIGGDAMKAGLSACRDQKLYYDRHAGEENVGECSSLQLAEMNCTSDGIKALMSTGQFEAFAKARGETGTDEEKEAASLKGFLIDQCVDCPEGASGYECDSEKYESGTSIVLVQAEDLRRVRVIVPKRTID